jgi:hypothetical protein
VLIFAVRYIVVSFWGRMKRCQLVFSGGGIVLGACAVLVLCNAARSQSSVPPGEPKPVFAAGLYETESRNSSFPDQPVKSRTCLTSASYDAFRDETMAQYREAPALKDCHLSDTETQKNGFGFAMQCQGTKTVLAYEFDKDLVRFTIDTLIESAPKYSSSILTTMRRIGDCPAQ